MSGTRVMALILYIFAVTIAYLLKSIVKKIAEKAIRERKLSTGIYRLIPIQGDQAVRLGELLYLTSMFYFAKSDF